MVDKHHLALRRKIKQLVHLSRQYRLLVCTVLVCFLLVWSLQPRRPARARRIQTALATSSLLPTQLQHLRSSHSVLERGLKPYTQIVGMEDVILWNGQVYFVSDIKAELPPYDVSWEVRKGNKFWNVTVTDQETSYHTFPFNITSDSPADNLGSVEEIEEAVFWYFKEARNYGHCLSEYAPSIHHNMCQYFKRCDYNPEDASWDALWLLQLDPDGSAVRNPFQRATEEMWQCFTSNPILHLTHPVFKNKAIIVKKALFGIGPTCRAYKWCSVDRWPLEPQHMAGFRNRLASCTGWNDGLLAPTKPPRIVVINRGPEGARQFLNIADIMKHLRKTYPHVRSSLHYVEEMTFAQQVQLFSQASVVINMHGSAMANWWFLPNGSAAVHVVPWTHSGELHEWGRDMVRDNPIVMELEEITNWTPTAAVLRKTTVLEDPLYMRLTPQQQEDLWERGECPEEHPPLDYVEDEATGEFYLPEVDPSNPDLGFHCKDAWFKLATDLVLDLAQLDRALERALLYIAEVAPQLPAPRQRSSRRRRKHTQHKAS